MPFNAKIKVTLRQSILDVQGKAVEHALKNLGYTTVDSARIGKYIEVSINEADRQEAERICNEICQKLLSNPVMENYAFELEQVN
ncbi:phosphoribosylformylglycinamidine synthase subunit PurS [Chlorobium sp.]|jgi:phosphoribosylformylglycinamidine synthase subunit PurS|uniref:phosphoribosylformylglycinamidine synthase subunit PurS n=1 Tax=Chlorobium sp. TaxID=1095 RepID=UPI003C346826|nr:phosphoribosylformylglycinamidine synthase subunit PurS [Chlorobiaceae bacterium]NTW93497.1 phosphoribosylformylglycinamidine synthase subunit PurS [Chlorobiaceae bacterium]